MPDNPQQRRPGGTYATKPPRTPDVGEDPWAGEDDLWALTLESHGEPLQADDEGGPRFFATLLVCVAIGALVWTGFAYLVYRLLAG